MGQKVIILGMEAPGITRQRRPFLAPIWITFLIIGTFGAVVLGLYNRAATTTVIVVRHAEKQLGTIDDPPLTLVGEERAQALAKLIGHRQFGAVEAIFATKTRRAQATAAPTAARLGLPVVATDAAPAALIRTIKADFHGTTVLIVGHSNTVTELVSRLSGRKDIPPIGEDEYGTIYIVAVPDLGRGGVTTLKY